MVDIALALQILALLPPLQFGTPDAAAHKAVEGTGVLLITACTPGEGMAIVGRDITTDITGVAGPDGTARITVPAQPDGADSYEVATAGGRARIHGTINAGEVLSGICP